MSPFPCKTGPNFSLISCQLDTKSSQVQILSLDDQRKMNLVIPPRGGFFSSILRVAGAVGKAVLGIPAAAPVTARALVPAVTGVVAGAAGAALIPGQAATALGQLGVTGFPVGAAVAREVVRKRTVVQSLNSQGLVIGSITLAGAPFLMKKDLVTAKRVFKLATKLHAKIPRRTVKESEIKQLKDAAVSQALQRVIAPPKPC